MLPEAPAGLGQHFKSSCFDCAQMEENTKKCDIAKRPWEKMSLLCQKNL